jgi:hypothetical protein
LEELAVDDAYEANMFGELREVAAADGWEIVGIEKWLCVLTSERGT